MLLDGGAGCAGGSLGRSGVRVAGSASTLRFFINGPGPLSSSVKRNRLLYVRRVRLDNVSPKRDMCDGEDWVVPFVACRSQEFALRRAVLK